MNQWRKEVMTKLFKNYAMNAYITLLFTLFLSGCNVVVEILLECIFAKWARRQYNRSQHIGNHAIWYKFS